MSRLVRLVLPVLALAFIFASAAVLPAQDKPLPKEQQEMMDAMMKAGTPGPNHKLLAEAVGDWTVNMRMWMDPAAPPTETNGVATFRSVFGGRYVAGTFKAPVMGMEFEGFGLNGYDNVTGQFVSIWYDNMSTGVMYMTGKYDPATKVYTYTGEMADPLNPSTMVKYRELLRTDKPGQLVMEMYEMRGGKEVKTMEGIYTRVK